MTSLVAVVVALAVYRIVLLATMDEITRPARDEIIARYVHPAHELQEWHPVGSVLHPDGLALCVCGQRWEAAANAGQDDLDIAYSEHVEGRDHEMTEGPWWLSLLDCVWCASVWVAPPVVASGWWWGTSGWWFVPFGSLAASGAASALGSRIHPEPAP